MNQYETEAMKEDFRRRGVEIVEETEPADVYIINTCTVTHIADRKSRQYIRRMKKLCPEARVAVTGCYAQVSPEELAAMPEVDLVIGNNLKTTLCDRLLELCASEDKQEAGGSEQKAEVEVLPLHEMTQYEEKGLVISSESSMCRAYVEICDGCNRFCSYCKIPYARGPVRSRDPEAVVREVEALVARGCKEIVLTGVNTAVYGSEPDFLMKRTPEEEGLTGLEALLGRLDALPGDFRIRLSSLEPTVVDVNDVSRIVRYKRLCHHLHLSVQSGNTKVLKDMNRRYTREEYLEIVRAIRAFDPLYGLTTDIIAGFPGETEEEFGDSVSMIGEAEFCRVHPFPFSPRRGTAAAEIGDTVDGSVKSARVKALIEEAERVQRAFFEKNFAVTHKVLIEEHREGFATGYTDNYIKVYIKDEDRRRAVNSFVNVRLIGHYHDGCLAEEAEKGR